MKRYVPLTQIELDLLHVRLWSPHTNEAFSVHAGGVSQIRARHPLRFLSHVVYWHNDLKHPSQTTVNKGERVPPGLHSSRMSYRASSISPDYTVLIITIYTKLLAGVIFV